MDSFGYLIGFGSIWYRFQLGYWIILSQISKGVLQRKDSDGPHNSAKVGNKSNQIRTDFCWFHIVFTDPTDTWRPVIGPFLIFFSFSGQKKN